VTAHAKAFGLAISAFDMAAQGLFYAWHTAVDDPALFATVRGRRVRRVCARRDGGCSRSGALLYLGYVVKVGGDFMAGRFFLPPFRPSLATVLAERLAQSTRRTCGLVVPRGDRLRGVGAGRRGLPRSGERHAAGQRRVEVMEAAHGIRRRTSRLLRSARPADTRAETSPGSNGRASASSNSWCGRREGRSDGSCLQGAVGVAGFGAGSSGTSSTRCCVIR
jgi:hypothetical protein